LTLFLYEGRKADLQAGRPVDRCNLASQRIDVVCLCPGSGEHQGTRQHQTPPRLDELHRCLPKGCASCLIAKPRTTLLLWAKRSGGPRHGSIEGIPSRLHVKPTSLNYDNVMSCSLGLLDAADIVVDEDDSASLWCPWRKF
jgi:hypothetical protein